MHRTAAGATGPRQTSGAGARSVSPHGPECEVARTGAGQNGSRRRENGTRERERAPKPGRHPVTCTWTCNSSVTRVRRAAWVRSRENKTQTTTAGGGAQPTNTSNQVPNNQPNKDARARPRPRVGRRDSSLTPLQSMPWKARMELGGTVFSFKFQFRTGNLRTRRRPGSSAGSLQ